MNDDVFAVSDRVYREVSEFLFREAQLLDNGSFKAWLELLSEHIQYRMLASDLSMSNSSAQAANGRTLIMDETLGTLTVRAQQLTTPAFTIAQNPRPFTRRFVTNILIDEGAPQSPLRVHSNCLVYRSRGNQMEPHVFSLSRCDSITRIDGTLRLLIRETQLDESVVGARNIAGLW